MDSDICTTCNCCSACKSFCTLHNPPEFYNPYKLTWVPHEIQNVWYVPSEACRLFWWILPKTYRFRLCHIALVHPNGSQQLLDLGNCVFSLVPPPIVSCKKRHLSSQAKLLRCQPESSSDLPVPRWERYLDDDPGVWIKHGYYDVQLCFTTKDSYKISDPYVFFGKGESVHKQRCIWSEAPPNEIGDDPGLPTE